MDTESLHELTAAYALDALDEHDEAAYEEHLRGCARCRDELASFRETAGALAYAVHPAAPPPELRSRILERARKERAPVVPLPRRHLPRVLAGVAAVAAAAAIGIGIWAAILQGDLSDTRGALAEQRAAAAVLADPLARRSTVSGAEGTLVVASDRRAVLALRGIEPAPRGKAYEVWVIRGRTPRPAGLFSSAGLVLLERRVPPGAIVGVTVEEAGGVDAPTEQPRFTARA
jgi:anti-sigma factor RsiW